MENGFLEFERKKKTTKKIMGKQISGAQKRKKKKEKEEAVKDMERLKLGPSKLWTGLVLHHKDVFVSHVLSKLNETDRFFFAGASGGSWEVLAYAKVLSKLSWNVYECSSISTLEFAWNNMEWGEISMWKSERSSLVLRASCFYEQTRVAQVGERSETVQVG